MTVGPRASSSTVLLGVGALVGVATISLIVSYHYFSRANDDRLQDYRKENPEGFEPGDSSMDDLLPPKQDTTTTERDDGATNHMKSVPDVPSGDRDSKRVTLADIIVSDVTTDESTNKELASEPLSLPPPLPSPASLPKTASKSYTIDGISTDMFVQVFSDRIMVGVSQLNGKFGNYLLCEAIPDEVNPKHIEYDVTTLLGAREDTLLTVYARQITERIEKLHPNPTSLTVIAAMSLNKRKAPQPEVFKAIVDLLVNLYRDALSNTTTT